MIKFNESVHYTIACLIKKKYGTFQPKNSKTFKIFGRSTNVTIF